MPNDPPQGPRLEPGMTPQEFIVRSQAALGLTSQGLARLAGVAPQTVRSWRMGRYEPSGAAVLRIVDALARRQIEVTQ